MASQRVRTRPLGGRRDVLTGIRDLGDLVALEAVPTLVPTFPNKLLVRVSIRASAVGVEILHR